MDDYIVSPLKVKLKQLEDLAGNVADSSRENNSSGAQGVNTVCTIAQLTLLLQGVFFHLNTFSQKNFTKQARSIYSASCTEYHCTTCKHVYIEQK